MITDTAAMLEELEIDTTPNTSKYCGALHVVNFFLRKSCYLSSVNAGVLCKPKCLLVQLSSEKKV